MISIMIVKAITQFAEKMLAILLGLIVLLAIGLVLLAWLPEDPLQSYILQWHSELVPYLGLLDYFIPVEYCAYSLAFCIAWKYIIKPISMAIKQMSGLDWNLASYNWDDI